MNHLLRFLACACASTAIAVSSAAAQQLVCYVQLVRGSDSPQPAQATAKEVGPLLGQKLKPVFRWKYYFVSQQEKLSLQREKASKIRLKDGTELEVQWLASDHIQVSLRKGKTQTAKTLHRNHPELMIIEGIESPNHEPWFVVLRRDKPLSPNPDTAAR